MKSDEMFLGVTMGAVLVLGGKLEPEPAFPYPFNLRKAAASRDR